MWAIPFVTSIFKTFLTRLEHNLTKSSVVNFLHSRFTELVTFGKKKNKKDESNS